MYHKQDIKWIKHLDFIILDIICAEIAFVIAFLLRHGSVNLPILFNSFYRQILILLPGADLVIILLCDRFHGVLKRGYYKELISSINQVIFVEGLILFYTFLVKSTSLYSRKTFVFFPFFYLMFSYAIRILWKNILFHSETFFSKRSLIFIVTADRVDYAFSILDETYANLFHIKGLVVLDQDWEGQVYGGLPVVANKENLLNYLTNEWVDEVLFSVSEYADINKPEGEFHDSIIEMISEMGITVHIDLGRLENIIGQKQMIEKIGRATVLTTSMNTISPMEVIIKRMMDIVGGLIGCFITLIFIIIFGPLIYIASPGPIFFQQDRVGRNGKVFKMYKFRSMYMDAEARKAELMEQNQMEDAYMFKLEFDPRIIGCKRLPDGSIKKGIGNYIRDLSIDEFPQFFNVLKGDMSLVGTRPPLVSEVAIYEHYHKSRLAMKPGITGMWQVSGRSKIMDFDEVVKLDRKYVNEWSIGLDLRILFKTIMVVLKRDGAM